MADSVKYKVIYDEHGNLLGTHTQVGVYGTLKSGYHRHPSLGIAKSYRGIAMAPGLLLSQGEHPMLVKQKKGVEFRPNNVVAIQVYSIELPQLKVLDGIEGHPHYFKREIVATSDYGDVFVYYGDPEIFLRGIVKVISGNVWNGADTFCVNVDFKDGNSKPHFRTQNPHMHIPSLINTETGEESLLLPDEPILEVPKTEIIQVPQGAVDMRIVPKIVNL